MEKAHSAYLPTIKYHILPSTNNNYFSLANKFDKWKHYCPVKVDKWFFEIIEI
jgi:hypothetical protein